MSHYSDRCCCGIHVHKGVMIIAIFGIISNVSLSVNWYGTSYVWYFALTGASSIVSLICYICLLIGNLKRMPVLYLPTLILNTIVLVLTCLLILWLFIAAGLTYAGHMHVNSDSGKTTVGTFMIIIAVLFLINVLLQAYFTHVVWRGWQYLKDDCLGHTGHTHVHVAHVA